MGHPSVDPHELKKWFDLAKDGDETGLSRLIDLTQDHLFRFCFYVCGNRTKTEDLCQEVFIKVLGNLDSIEDSTKFMPWLFRVAKNHFIDTVRSPKSKETSIETQEAKGGFIESVESSPQVALEVREALNQLSDEERAVILLVDSEGYSYAEGARILGISEEAFKSRTFRARKSFIEIYSKN